VTELTEKTELMTSLLAVFHFLVSERSVVETVSELRVFMLVANPPQGRSGSVMGASVSSAAPGNCSSPDEREQEEAACCAMFISWYSAKKRPVKSFF
jgi:hypothetical protein